MLIIVLAPRPCVPMTEDAEQQSGHTEYVRQRSEQVRAVLLEQEEGGDQSKATEHEQRHPDLQLSIARRHAATLSNSGAIERDLGDHNYSVEAPEEPREGLGSCAIAAMPAGGHAQQLRDWRQHRKGGA